jgi:hypothetical protein
MESRVVAERVVEMHGAAAYDGEDVSDAVGHEKICYVIGKSLFHGEILLIKMLLGYNETMRNVQARPPFRSCGTALREEIPKNSLIPIFPVP